MKKYAFKGLGLVLAVALIVGCFAGCAKINYVTDGAIQAINEVKDGSWKTKGQKDAATSEADYDKPVIEEFKAGTYGGVEFKDVAAVADYYKQAYDYTKTLTAQYKDDKGQTQTYYKMLCEEDLNVHDIAIDGSVNKTINNMVPGIVKPIYKPGLNGLVPSTNRDPKLDTDEWDGKGESLQTSRLVADDLVTANVKDNGDGTYTIVNMPNADMHITINKMAKALDPDAVDVVKYLELDNKTMYMVTVWGELSHTNLGSTNTTYIAYTYDDNLMYDTSYYTAPNGTKGASSWLVIVDKGEEFTKEEALKHLKLVESTQEQNKNISLVYFGIDPNVNGSKGGQLDINDVQLVYDMYNSLYENFEQVSVKKFLLADQTLDRQLNSADAVKLADKLGY